MKIRRDIWINWRPSWPAPLKLVRELWEFQGGASRPDDSHETHTTHPRTDCEEIARGGDLAGRGNSIEEVFKGLAISPATYHRWEKEYGGADVNTLRENKALREENARLKKLVADQALDLSLIKELVEGKWWARRANEKPWRTW